jgi:copper homeostasis protein
MSALDPATPFECCADSVAGALAAEAAGAARVELCDGLTDGGVTPSAGKVAACAARLRVPLHVLVRPRPGDFCYSPLELEVMRADVAHCKAAGAAGVVLGVLTPDGAVDAAATAELVALARPMRVTFHRAVDAARDPLAALAACVALGVDFVLTSGGARSAPEGAGVLAAMVRLVDGARGCATRIVAGGGVTAGNARALVERTGVHAVHGSGREWVDGAMVFRREPPVYMGAEKVNTPAVEYGSRVATAASVGAIVAALAAATRPPAAAAAAAVVPGGGAPGEGPSEGGAAGVAAAAAPAS